MVEEFIGHVKMLIDDSGIRQEMSEKSKMKVQEFSIKKNVQKYKDIFENLISNYG